MTTATAGVIKNSEGSVGPRFVEIKKGIRKFSDLVWNGVRKEDEEGDCDGSTQGHQKGHRGSREIDYERPTDEIHLT